MGQSKYFDTVAIIYSQIPEYNSQLLVTVEVVMLMDQIMAGLTEVMERVPTVVAARGRTSPPTPSVPGPSHLGLVE